jgi:hypothetical protein
MMRSLLGGAVLLLVLGGCILITPPIGNEEHCSISGTSACATCLRQSCTKPIDACCGSTLCAGIDGHSSTLEGLDSCGGGDKTECARKFGGAPSSSSFDNSEPVQTCVQTTCKDVCF